MPSNKNALTRIVLLDKLLADRYHAYSIHDMTLCLERELPKYGQVGGVSKRCVEKDIEYLEYNFPIPIELERYTVDARSAATDKVYKKRCLRYSDPTFSIFKGKLTAEEKGILTTALATIGSFDGLDGFGWLDDLNKRLGLVEQQPVIQLSKNLLENKTLMAEAFSAIQAHAVVKLQYKRFDASHMCEVIVSPYLLKEYNRRWYLIGAAYDTGRVLNFALDRLVSIAVLPGYEYRQAPADLLERYEDIVGITYYEGAQLYKIVFWVSDKSAPYVATKPLHGSQIRYKGEREAALRQQYQAPPQGALFSIACMENYELIRELCSYGGELKVLSPQPIIDAVTSRIKEMATLYGL